MTALPTTTIARARVDYARRRINDYTTKHGHPPTPGSAYAVYFEILSSWPDTIHALTHAAQPAHPEHEDRIVTALREIAILCAEAVLPIWESAYPNDGRPAEAINAARGGDRAAATLAADNAGAAALGVGRTIPGAASAAHSASMSARAVSMPANGAHAACACANAAVITAITATINAVGMDAELIRARFILARERLDQLIMDLETTA